MNRKKIFMICYGNSHARIIGELARYIQDYHSDRYFCEILGLTIASEVLESYSVPYYPLSYFYDLPLTDVQKNYGIKFSETTANPKCKETLLYMGVSYDELVLDTDETIACDLFNIHGRACFHPWRTLVKILKRVNPDIVITTNSPRMERASLTASRILNIPSICISDGLGDTEKYKLFADTLCVYNSFAEKHIKDKLFYANEIIVTGQPVLQRAYEKINKAEPQLKEDSILIAGPNQRDSIEWCRDVLNTCINFLPERILLYFKPHPNLPGSFIDEFKHFSNRIIFVEKGSIQNWLLRCSNFICAQSISSIESVICKNKTMVHITKGNKIPAIVHSDSVLLSTTPEELKQNFNKNNPLTQKIYESFVNSSDSLRNIFSVIERKCHGKSKSI